MADPVAPEATPAKGTTPLPPTWGDVVANQQALLMGMAARHAETAARHDSELAAVGVNVLSAAQLVNTTLANMFAVRAAQSNPVESASIRGLQQESQAGSAQNAAAIQGLLAPLAAMFANLAHVTPATQAPPTQKGP